MALNETLKHIEENKSKSKGDTNQQGNSVISLLNSIQRQLGAIVDRVVEVKGTIC